MPTYAYLCKDCGEALEVQQSFSDDALTTCTKCQGTLRKQFGAVGVVFKGSGFYSNDSRAPSASGKPGSKTNTESSSETGGSSTGADSKHSSHASTGTSSDAKASSSAAKSGSGSSTPSSGASKQSSTTNMS